MLLLFFHIQPFENILIRQLRLKIVKLLIEINIFGYQSIFHRNLKKYTQFAASLLLVPIYYHSMSIIANCLMAIVDYLSNLISDQFCQLISFVSFYFLIPICSITLRRMFFLLILFFVLIESNKDFEYNYLIIIGLFFIKLIISMAYYRQISS